MALYAAQPTVLEAPVMKSSPLETSPCTCQHCNEHNTNQYLSPCVERSNDELTVGCRDGGGGMHGTGPKGK